jgi:hypothetical protein
VRQEAKEARTSLTTVVVPSKRTTNRPYVSTNRCKQKPRPLRPGKRKKLLDAERLLREMKKACCSLKHTQQSWFSATEVIKQRKSLLKMTEQEVLEFAARKYGEEILERKGDYKVAFGSKEYFVCASAWRLFFGFSKHKHNKAIAMAKAGNVNRIT